MRFKLLSPQWVPMASSKPTEKDGVVLIVPFDTTEVYSATVVGDRFIADELGQVKFDKVLAWKRTQTALKDEVYNKLLKQYNVIEERKRSKILERQSRYNDLSAKLLYEICLNKLQFDKYGGDQFIPYHRNQFVEDYECYRNLASKANSILIDNGYVEKVVVMVDNTPNVGWVPTSKAKETEAYKQALEDC